MKIFKKILKRAAEMTELAWCILHGSLMISSTMLLCSILLFAASLPLSPSTYSIYKYAYEFFSFPATILLVGVLGSVIVEDIVIQKK